MTTRLGIKLIVLVWVLLPASGALATDNTSLLTIPPGETDLEASEQSLLYPHPVSDQSAEGGPCGFPLAPAADIRALSPVTDLAVGQSARPWRLLQQLARRIRVDRRVPHEITNPTPRSAQPGRLTAIGDVAHFPGEFEPCGALLLSCDELAAQFPEVFGQVVAASQKKQVPVVGLVSSQETGQYAEKVLAKQKVPAGSVRFLRVPHDSMWVRDYGPICLAHPGGKQSIVDTEYGAGLQRVNDEQVPGVLAQLLGEQALAAPIMLDGGNLLSNGQGLCLTTTSLLDANMERQLDEAGVAKLLHRFLGVEEVMILEPLSGEPTGHVDMFATFLAPDTVVIGSYDRSLDPVNADILDRNAARLADVRTPRGPMRVVRIPMPSNDDGVWRSYTNVIMANGVLMVPVYPDVDAGCQQEALSVYRRVLPNWQIVTIDSSGLITCGGALHCISSRLVSLAGWRQARDRSVALPEEHGFEVPRRLVRRSR